MTDEPDRSRGSYAAQWPIFASIGVFMAAMAVSQTEADFAAVTVAVVGCSALLMFLAGFTYRERLRQLGREPRLRWFQRMIS